MSQHAVLKILQGVHQGVSLDLPPGYYTLGADDDCEIVLLDEGIADHHLSFEVTEGRVILNLLSDLPAFVNDAPLTDEPYALSASCELKVAGVELGFIAPPDWLNKHEPVLVNEPEDLLPAEPEPAMHSSGANSAGAYMQRPTPVKKSPSRVILLLSILLAGTVVGSANTVPESWSTRGRTSASALAKEIRALGEPELDVQLADKKIQLGGYVRHAATDLQIQALLANAQDLPVVAKYQVIDSLTHRIAEFLDEPRLRIDYSGRGIFILSGTAASPRYREQARRLESDLAGIVRIEHREQVLPGPTPPPVELPVNIVSVGFTPLPYFLTQEGARYFVGGKMPNGDEVVDISNTKIVFSRNGRTTIYQLAHAKISSESTNETP